MNKNEEICLYRVKIVNLIKGPDLLFVCFTIRLSLNQERNNYHTKCQMWNVLEGDSTFSAYGSVLS